MKNIGTIVSIYLKQNKMTQSALAKKAEVAESTISNIVHGRRYTSVVNLDKVAGAMGVSLVTLLKISQRRTK